jgi:hypothetical protein
LSQVIISVVFADRLGFFAPKGQLVFQVIAYNFLQ